jgi:hypothetical protein
MLRILTYIGKEIRMMLPNLPVQLARATAGLLKSNSGYQVCCHGQKNVGRCESAGINRHRVGDERAPHERSS